MAQTLGDITSTQSPVKLSRLRLIVLGVSLLSLGLSIWQLAVPGYLYFGDSGVYLGASIRLAYGVLPYKDFSFVQPPGILWLMSPVALLSRLIGSSNAFVLARVISALVTAINVGLLAWLVRHRGRVAMLISGAGLALLPVASFVSTGVRLEPYCLCFTLLACVVIFSRAGEQGPLSRRFLALGGVLFGAAVLVKLWALFPLVAMIICLVPRYRLRVFVLLAAASGTFIAFTLPFFISAPSNFMSQVFIEQIGRKSNFNDSLNIVPRLIDLTGFPATAIGPTSAEAVVGLCALLCLVALAYWRRLEHESVDIFMLVATLITVSALLTASVSYNYYYYFTAPFLLGLFGVSIARLGQIVRKTKGALTLSESIRRIVVGASVVGGTILVFALLLYGTTFYNFYMGFWGEQLTTIAPITKLIPAGSCVVYIETFSGILSNRLDTGDPKCPEEVDPEGMWMSRGYELIPATPTFVALWKSYFEAAQYVVLRRSYVTQTDIPGAINSSVIPWNAGLKVWFKSNYHLLYAKTGLVIYEKNTDT
jgi:hypothetical protein